MNICMHINVGFKCIHCIISTRIAIYLVIVGTSGAPCPPPSFSLVLGEWGGQQSLLVLE